MNYEDIVDFLYEAGLQKHVKRSGWWVAGVKDPETIAEHSQRAALLAFIIAKLEGANPYKASVMCTIHDLAECRINDGHKIAARYLDLECGENEAFKHQMELLPKSISDELSVLFDDFQNKKSKEAIIAKDADYLECAIQAKEYLDIGYKSTQGWIDNAEKRLVTKTAKEILKNLRKRNSKAWFPWIKKVIK